jgi:hypothetical protein
MSAYHRADKRGQQVDFLHIECENQIQDFNNRHTKVLTGGNKVNGTDVHNKKYI